MGEHLEIDPETKGILTLWTKYSGLKHLDLLLGISNLEKKSKVMTGREYPGYLLLKWEF